MGILNIAPVQREGARTLIILTGVSGCGKTYTAIQIAVGMANGDQSKVGFLDTENGRGKLYADSVKSPFLYGELKPPFSPARYVQAINEFAAVGVEVLVIDSGTHEWEGLGGCQDIAEAGNPRMPNWNLAKSEHKKFMSALLNSPMHIILCLRAREKSVPEKIKDPQTGRDKTVYVDYGLQPITEKNVVFEATASLMLHDQGSRQESLKVPAALQPILGRGTGYITEEDGRAIRAWVDGAKQLDAEVERHRGLLQMAAENGMAALVAAWGNVPKAVKAKIGPNGCPDDLKASAQAFDDAAAAAKAAVTGEAGNDAAAVASLNNLVAAQADEPQPKPAKQAAQPEPEPAPEPQHVQQQHPVGGQADDNEYF